MTEDEIEMLWLYTAEAWPQFKIPHENELVALKMQVWVDQLGDLSGVLVRGALVALGNHEFPPPLGLVREKALELDSRRRGETPAPDIDQAWKEVMASFGSPHEWSHPALAEAVAAIGHRNIGRSENLDVIRGQFTKMYGVCRERHHRETSPPPPALVALMSGAKAIKRADDFYGIGPAS